MKSLNIILGLVLGLVGFVSQASAQAPARKKAAFERPYGMAGCGLGSVVMGNKRGQILASTTNGSSYNNVFGMTFGTLNCVDGPANEVAGNVDKFIIGNRASLEVDMVKGRGETLSALHQVLNCKGEQTQFNGFMKQNYRQIFAQPQMAPNEVTDNIMTVIINQSELNCAIEG